MSHVSPLSLLSPDGEDIAPLSQLMRQTLNLRLTDLFSSTCLFPNDLVEKLVCSPKINYRLSLLPHLSASEPRTPMLSKPPAVRNACRHICSGSTCPRSSKGTLGIVCSPCTAEPVVWHRRRKTGRLCQASGFVVLCFLFPCDKVWDGAHMPQWAAHNLAGSNETNEWI